MAENQNPQEVPEIPEEQRQRMMFKKLLRRKRRKDREAEGEIKELNITAMMDMMTIILVFLLKSYSATSITMASSGDVAPPISSTRLTPKDTIAVTVTRCAPGPDKSCAPGTGTVMVMEKVVFTYDNDRTPDALKQGGADGMLIVPLKEALEREIFKVRRISRGNSSVQFTGELSVVGDKNMPYRMLTEILYTAGQTECIEGEGLQNEDGEVCSLDSYRFLVLKKEGESAPSSSDG